MEVEEFVRVGALVLHADARPRRRQRSTDRAGRQQRALTRMPAATRQTAPAMTHLGAGRGSRHRPPSSPAAAAS